MKRVAVSVELGTAETRMAGVSGRWRSRAAAAVALVSEPGAAAMSPVAVALDLWSR
jgi:hypothetical protein